MKSDRISRLCLLVLFAASLLSAAFTIVNNVQRSRIFHQLDYEEGNILNAALRINQGLTPYPNPHSWPVVINPYGPLPYYLTAIPVHFFGASFAPARALVIVLCIACGLLAGLFVHHYSGSPLLGASFACLFLSHRLVGAWMPILRVDFVALVLVLLGLYVFARWPDRWWITALLFSIAVFTKFNFVAAPSACFFYLLIQKQGKRAVQFALEMSLLVAAFFGVAILATHGTFTQDVFMTETSPMAWRQLPYFDRLVLGSNPVAALLALAGLLWALRTKQFELPMLYAIFALLESITAAKVGSNLNHLLELVTASIILAGWFVGQMLRRHGAAAVASCAAATLLGVWAVVLLRYAPNSRPIPACTDVYHWVAQLPSDRILSEDVGALVVGGKSVWISNSFSYNLLSTSPTSPDTQLEQRIDDKWFDYILLGYDLADPSYRWSAPVKQAILKNYVLAGQSSCRDLRYIYVPARQPQKP